MRVALTGGTGFVGSHILARLEHDDRHEIRVLARAGQAQAPSRAKTNFFEGDVVSGKGLDRLVEGCDAVIHLVGIILETGTQTFERVHHQGTRNLVNAARAAGVKRFVQMSALGARADGVSAYQTSKWRGEEAVRQSDMDFVVLRPSLIFGPRDGFVSQMLGVMRSSPLVRPVVGHGGYKFRPIFIDDVVECFVQSLSSEQARNRTLELGGPEELTLEQILDAIAACVGIRKPKVHVPFWVMYMNAGMLGTVMSRPPVTTDQLRMLAEGSTCDISAMRETFHLNPTGFVAGLRTYLCPAVDTKR